MAARTLGPAAVESTVHDKGDGTYTVELSASCKGEYRVVISLNGHQVNGLTPPRVGSAPMLRPSCAFTSGEWLSTHPRR